MIMRNQFNLILQFKSKKQQSNKNKKELTRRKRYDKLNTPLRLEKDIETEEKKKSENKYREVENENVSVDN